jgi:hypothetical protein
MSWRSAEKDARRRSEWFVPVFPDARVWWSKMSARSLESYYGSEDDPTIQFKALLHRLPRRWIPGSRDDADVTRCRSGGEADITALLPWCRSRRLTWRSGGAGAREASGAASHVRARDASASGLEWRRVAWADAGDVQSGETIWRR